MATLVRSIFAQPDEAEVLAQHQRVWSSSPTASPKPVSYTHLDVYKRQKEILLDVVPSQASAPSALVGDL